MIMKICFAYSNRAEFSEIEPFYQNFKSGNCVKLLDLSKIVKNIDDDKNLAKVYSKSYSFFIKGKFDYVIVLGDRRELPMVVIPAFLLGIKIVHLASGDQAESITSYDQYIRPIISLMSTLQICFSKKSKKNIEKVFSSISYLKSESSFIGNPVFKDINLNKLKRHHKENYDIVLLHPQSLSSIETKKDIKTVEKLLKNKKTIFIKGNNDSNSELVFNFYNKIKKNKKYIFVKSVEKEKYFSLIKYCDKFLTNSSSTDEINFLNNKCLIVIGKRNKNRNHDEFNDKSPELLLKILKKHSKKIIKK
jgi:UDP-N-acetylglucosamine 2-epimerase